MRYLTPGDPGAFIDHEKKPVPAGMVECPQCHGHGGWNLIINAYPLPVGLADTADNRRRHVHFRARCSNCFGHGYVRAEQRNHVHLWSETNLGSCLHQWTCSCGESRIVDSSD